MPQKYEHDETKDKALSRMDALAGSHTSHLDDDFIFKMANGDTATFIWKGYAKYSMKIKNDKQCHTVTFCYFGEHGSRIDGGISIETDIGIFRPQTISMSNELKTTKLNSIKGLSIRQLYGIAERAIKEYTDFLKIMSGMED